MGCNLSKSHTLTHVDDSVHVMLSHEKKVAKKKGMADIDNHNTYVPRAEHPLLANKNHNLNNNTNNTTSDTTNTSTTLSTSSPTPTSQPINTATVTATEES